MRLRKLSLTMVIGLALLPVATSAQQQGRTTQIITVGKRGWLGISYNFNSTSRDGKVTETLTVMDVIKDSPADRAGVKRGDRILLIDGKAITEDQLSLLARRVEPGDKVELRIATGDRERDVTLVAANDEGMIFLRGDSINRAVRIYLDSARAGVIRMESLFGDSLHENVIGQIGRARIYPGTMMPNVHFNQGMDSLFFKMDSVFFRGWRDRDLHFFNDSVPRMWQRIEVPREFEMFEMPRFEALAERAVAGAEFTPINDGLAGYFGTDRGLLVVKVGPQTPAARAGLISGDVITRVDGQYVDEVIDFRRAITRAGNETLKLEILRKGKKQTVEFQPRTRR